MVDDWPEWLSSPADFRGNFGGFIERVQEDLEAHYGDDVGGFKNVAERAEAKAPFMAAKSWLVERWGDHFPCPVCQNIEWTVSEVAPSELSGFLAFYVVCGYCANAMRIVPGHAGMDAPHLPAALRQIRGSEG